MTRNAILLELKKLRFCVFWPENWDDVEFTERPMWINSFGYGYIACDEPCDFGIINNISDDIVHSFKESILNNTLTYDEFRKSPFVFSPYFITNEIEFKSNIKEYLNIPDHVNNSIFCGVTESDWLFFNSEEELILAFDKQNDSGGCYTWEELDDELLNTWYDRIFIKEELDLILPITLNITKY